MLARARRDMTLPIVILLPEQLVAAVHAECHGLELFEVPVGKTIIFRCLHGMRDSTHYGNNPTVRDAWSPIRSARSEVV